MREFDEIKCTHVLFRNAIADNIKFPAVIIKHSLSFKIR